MRKLFTVFLMVAVLTVVACTSSPADSSGVTPLPTVGENATATPTLTPTNTPEPAAESDEPVAVAAVQATPTPLDLQLQAGESRRIALATDIPLVPEIRGERITFEEEVVPLQFGEFYDGFDLRRGLLLSDKLTSLDGQRVVIEGYMAPPLKPALDWFVLTKVPLALCPFCSTDADWPQDIVLAYMPDGETIIATEDPLRLIGTLQVGTSTDAETGMVSVIRLYVEELERI